jgi:hypothetical protein
MTNPLYLKHKKCKQINVRILFATYIFSIRNWTNLKIF